MSPSSTPLGKIQNLVSAGTRFPLNPAMQKAIEEADRRTHALANANRPKAAAVNRYLADFFSDFPGARDFLSIRYKPGGGGAYRLTFPGFPVVEIGVEGSVDFARQVALHEPMHFLSVIDQWLHGSSQRPLKEFVKAQTGVDLGDALQLNPELRAQLATEISNYAATRLAELIPEAYVHRGLPGVRSNVGDAIVDYFLQEYGGEAGTERIRAGCEAEDTVIYQLEGGWLACSSSIRWTEPTKAMHILTVDGEVFRICDYRAYGIDEGSERERKFGAVVPPSCGEPLMLITDDVWPDKIPLDERPEIASAPIAEIFQVTPHALSADKLACIGYWPDTRTEVPDWVLTYEQRRIELLGAHLDSEPTSPLHFVATPDGRIALAYDGGGFKISPDEMARSTPFDVVNVEYHDGTRVSFDSSNLRTTTPDGEISDESHSDLLLSSENPFLQYLRITAEHEEATGIDRYYPRSGAISRMETAPLPFRFDAEVVRRVCGDRVSQLWDTSPPMSDVQAHTVPAEILGSEHALTRADRTRAAVAASQTDRQLGFVSETSTSAPPLPDTILSGSNDDISFPDLPFPDDMVASDGAWVISPSEESGLPTPDEALSEQNQLGPGIETGGLSI